MSQPTAYQYVKLGSNLEFLRGVSTASVMQTKSLAEFPNLMNNFPPRRYAVVEVVKVLKSLLVQLHELGLAESLCAERSPCGRCSPRWRITCRNSPIRGRHILPISSPIISSPWPSKSRPPCEPNSACRPLGSPRRSLLPEGTSRAISSWPERQPRWSPGFSRSPTPHSPLPTLHSPLLTSHSPLLTSHSYAGQRPMGQSSCGSQAFLSTKQRHSAHLPQSPLAFRERGRG